ncbi:serine hydrolase domain-containing protein [Rheinheimera sp. MMS21-TC3]|uniref:serine hydrolase domain-containing protein n=1 Tax=Rheinheimera sp. MMS21-TC3 TaxID=3072790 RepID=UPI0028C3862E|nr:serine hydrolase domain-containing protein [Rheinheimera sp. MMS21-TC3]WNO61536.1 serine hydrolase domain-containing protein [Rheinheimera sp. MMS21-TC3]
MARNLCSRNGYAANAKKKALAASKILPSISTLSSWLTNEFNQHAVAIAFIAGQDVKYHFHGLADLATATALNNDTKFEIGSISKPLTALATLAVAKENGWQLEQPLSSLFSLPQFSKHQYTLAELISHRSGLPRLPTNISVDDMTDPYANYNLTNLLEAAARTEFSDRTFHYSNYGYGILGSLLTHDLKQSYSDIMHQRVFKALDMTTAVVQTVGVNIDKLATGYAINGEPVPHWHFDSMAGAGSIVASIDDMVAMLQTVFKQKDQNSIIERWLTPLTLADKPAMTVGWMLNNDLLWHNGQTSGFASFIAFNPKQQVGIVVLSNIAIPVNELGLLLLKEWTTQAQQQKGETE